MGEGHVHFWAQRTFQPLFDPDLASAPGEFPAQKETREPALDLLKETKDDWWRWKRSLTIVLRLAVRRYRPIVCAMMLRHIRALFGCERDAPGVLGRGYSLLGGRNWR